MAMASSFSRRVSALVRTQTTSVPTRSSSVRCFSADYHGPPKVNFWQDPMSPSKWKEEHFVLLSLAGWGLLGYGVAKAFSSLKKPPPKEEIHAHH